MLKRFYARQTPAAVCLSCLSSHSVCHFGAKFSAYRRQRLGALLTRITHNALADAPHKAWLYVDDLLLLLRSAQHQELAWSRTSYSKYPQHYAKSVYQLKILHGSTTSRSSGNTASQEKHHADHASNDHVSSFHRSRRFPRRLSCHHVDEVDEKLLHEGVDHVLHAQVRPSIKAMMKIRFWRMGEAAEETAALVLDHAVGVARVLSWLAQGA